MFPPIRKQTLAGKLMSSNESTPRSVWSSAATPGTFYFNQSRNILNLDLFWRDNQERNRVADGGEGQGLVVVVGGGGQAV